MIDITYYFLETRTEDGWRAEERPSYWVRTREEAEAMKEQEVKNWKDYLANEIATQNTASAIYKAHWKQELAKADDRYKINQKVIKYTHASEYGYSDVHAYEIVKVISDKTIEVREMKATHDIAHLKQHVGGFSGHVENQRDQKVTYESDTDAPVFRIRRSKHDLEKWTYKGSRFGLTTRPYAFYDYNF